MRAALYVAGTVLALAVAVWWNVAQWTECRDAGFSVMYCIQHVG